MAAGAQSEPFWQRSVLKVVEDNSSSEYQVLGRSAVISAGNTSPPQIQICHKAGWISPNESVGNKLPDKSERSLLLCSRQPSCPYFHRGVSGGSRSFEGFPSSRSRVSSRSTSLVNVNLIMKSRKVDR